MQIIGVDGHVDRHCLRAQRAQVEVIRRSRPIEDRVLPELEPGSERLANAAGRDRRQIDDVVEGSYTLRRERSRAAPATLHEPLPVLTEPFLTARHALAQDLPERLRQRWRLEEIERNAKKQGASGRDPERICAGSLRIEHVGDALHVVDTLRRGARHIGKRVPARRNAYFREWVEQEACLARRVPKSRGDGPVLALMSTHTRSRAS